MHHVFEKKYVWVRAFGVHKRWYNIVIKMKKSIWDVQGEDKCL